MHTKGPRTQAARYLHTDTGAANKKRMESTETLKTTTTATNKNESASQITGAAVVSQQQQQPSQTAASSAMSPQVASPKQSAAFPIMVVAQHGASTLVPCNHWDAIANLGHRLSRGRRRRDCIPAWRDHCGHCKGRWLWRWLVDGNSPFLQYPCVHFRVLLRFDRVSSCVRTWGGGVMGGRDYYLHMHLFCNGCITAVRSWWPQLLGRGVGSLCPSTDIVDRLASWLAAFPIGLQFMSQSPPITPPGNWSFQPVFPVASLSCSSSVLLPRSRFRELLAKFPLPPQGRNVQNQIGLFPAIYTIPYQPPTPGSAEVRPLSPQSPNPLQRSFSSESEGVYEGLGIHSDQVYAVDSQLNHNESSASDIEDTLANFSIQSSASSVLSSELVNAELLTTEDDSTDGSSEPINPILAQIRQWSPKDVAAFIADRGFPNQAQNFVRHEISGAILLELDLAMLKEVDITAFGIRYQIMREIEGLRKLGAPPPRGTSRQAQSRHGATVRLPIRSPTRSVTSGDDEDEPYRRPASASPAQKRDVVSPLPQFSSRSGHSRQSSYEPSTPRSVISPRPLSMSSDPSRLSVQGAWDRQRSSAHKFGHRSTISQDSGFGGSNHSTPDIDSGSTNSRPGHRKSRSTSGMEGLSPPERMRVASQDSGLGHSRHTSTDTVIKSPKNGHKRQSSSLATVRVQPPSIPLMQAAGKPNDTKNLPSIPTSSAVILPGTRSETPPTKSGPKFLIAPNSIRSPMSERERSGSVGESNVRLVKSYSALRRRSSSTASPVSPTQDDSPRTDLHHHRSVLLKNLPAKDAAETADLSGWLKKRTEKGTSIAGLNVGPGVGMVGGWKKRFFVLKGRRLSYYHSEKVLRLHKASNSRTKRRKE